MLFHCRMDHDTFLSKVEIFTRIAEQIYSLLFLASIHSLYMIIHIVYIHHYCYMGTKVE